MTAFKVQVGPPQIAIHRGQTVLVVEPHGQITWPSEKGLYFLDTRIISNWAIYANGKLWERLNGGPINYDAAQIFLTKSILRGRSDRALVFPRRGARKARCGLMTLDGACGTCSRTEMMRGRAQDE
jgi:hypothetical protein